MGANCFNPIIYAVLISLDYSVIRQSGSTDLNNNKFNRILCRLNHVSQFYISQCPRVQQPDETLMYSAVC